jgi:murein L,D-transpeptidase YafK
VGCYAMTDGLMEEIYALAREAFIGGQDMIQVHAFPFRMTDAKMQEHRDSPHYQFWTVLKEGYEYFETSRQLPSIGVCERRYVVNVAWQVPVSRINPEGACPPFMRPKLIPFVPAGNERLAEERIVVAGPRMRTAAMGTQTAVPAADREFGARSGLGLGFSR